MRNACSLVNMNERFSDQFREELPHLWRFGLRLSGSRDVSEELVQKTILRALEKRHQFSEGTKLRSWLFTILHSVWKNEMRAQAIRKNVSFNTVEVEQAASNIGTVDNAIFLKEVMKRVVQLPEAQRTVMLLVCVEGYSYKEAGEILEIPIGTVMSRLARSRLQIGSAFTEVSQLSTGGDLQEQRDGEK